MKYYFLALLLFFSNSSMAAGDEWTGGDKTAHFGISAAMGLAAYSYTEDKTTAFGMAMVPGIIKEVADSQKEGGRFSEKDLAWDALGAFVGVQAGGWMMDSKGVSWGTSFY